MVGRGCFVIALEPSRFNNFTWRNSSPAWSKGLSREVVRGPGSVFIRHPITRNYEGILESPVAGHFFAAKTTF